jgi:hypothetical protein
MGLDVDTAAAGIEICSTFMQYIDFTIPTTSTQTYDFRGRMIYNNDASSFAWHVGGSGNAKMTLNGTALSVAANLAMNNNSISGLTDLTASGTITPSSISGLTDLTATGTITASSIVKSGGTSSQYLMADGSTSPKVDVSGALNEKIGGSGTQYYLPKFTDTRVVANSSFQENAIAQIGIGGSPDNYFKLRITGSVYVDDSTSPNGIVLASQLNSCPLISRQMNNFTSGKIHILADGVCLWNQTSCS